MSHQSFTRLTGSGFSEAQTEALFDVYGDGHESLVTQRDIEPLATRDDLQALRTEMQAFATKDDLERFATKDDLQTLRTEMQAFATKDDLGRFATKDDLERFATKDDLEGFARKDDLHAFATKVDLQGGLQALELRLTLRFGALMVAGVAVLAALERL